MQAADFAPPGTCRRLVEVTTRDEEEEKERAGELLGRGGAGPC